MAKTKKYRDPNKAVAYMRYSSHNQTENSIEYQRTVIQRYCTENQIEIVKEYIDEAYTATNDQRPQFQQMMHDAWEKPEWSTILVYDYSRFARNTDDATIYTGMLDNTKTNLISVTQPFTESIEGTLLKHIIHAINEFQSQVISKHTHDGLRNYANKTQHCGGIPPLGYDVGEDRTLVINEEEAKIVKDIFDMYECGYSYNKMKDELNAKGCRTKVGEPFTKHSFKDILRQEKYTGLYTWDKRVGKDRKGKHNSHEHKPLDKQVRIENGCPQIIDQEQFERVQKKMNARADGVADSKARHHYMLGGLQKIRCAECGSTMQGTKCTSHGKEYFTYFCPKHKAKECSTRAIRTEAIDCFVTGILMRDLYYRDDLQAISASMKQTNEVKALQEKLKGNEKATQNILKAIQYGNTELLSQKLKQLSEQRQQLQQELRKYQTCLDGITEDNKREICKAFRQHLQTARDLAVKKYLSQAVKEVLVSNDDVTVVINQF